MITRLQSPTNITLLKNIISNYFMFYVMGLLLVVIILVLIKIAYKLFQTTKGNIPKSKFLNFYIYKLLVLTVIGGTTRIFIAIIFFIDKRTISLLLDYIVGKINLETIIQNHIGFSIIINNGGLFLGIILGIILLIPTILPFSSRKKLGKFGIWVLIFILLLTCTIEIIGHIFG